MVNDLRLLGVPNDVDWSSLGLDGEFAFVGSLVEDFDRIRQSNWSNSVDA